MLTSDNFNFCEIASFTRDSIKPWQTNQVIVEGTQLLLTKEDREDGRILAKKVEEMVFPNII